MTGLQDHIYQTTGLEPGHMLLGMDAELHGNTKTQQEQ